jgi:PhnB protein
MPKKVKPVPKGYRTVTPGLSVQGADAFIKFCKKAFGAKEVLRMAGPGGSVMHAELEIGDSRIMIGDENPHWGNKSAKTLGGTPLTLHIYVPDCDAMVAKAVKAGATVLMPLADQFWGDRFGTVADPFGNVWAVATHGEDVDAKEMKKRGAKVMKEMAAAAAQAQGAASA